MFKNEHERFLYGGHAIALSGRITSPVQQTLSPTVAATLPVCGGHEHQRVHQVQMNGIVTADNASVQVAGVTQHNHYATLVTASIEKLNILDMVTADRVVARLAAECPTGAGEPSVYLVGSHFENLRIAGTYVRFSMDEGLLSGMPSPYSVRPGVNSVSIVHDIENAPGQVQGCRIDIPQFGSVYLGELFITREARRLTMLRIELSCAVEGTLIACELGGNGAFSLSGDNPTRPKG